MFEEEPMLFETVSVFAVLKLMVPLLVVAAVIESSVFATSTLRVPLPVKFAVSPAVKSLAGLVEVPVISTIAAFASVVKAMATAVR